MKILFSHFGIYKKGGWGRTFPLAKGLVSLGNQVVLLTSNPKLSILIKTEIIDGVKVIVFPDIIGNKLTSKGYGFLSLFLKIVYVLFNKFDIVHSDVGHRPSSGIPCRVNKRIYKSIYIAEWWDLFGKGGQYDNKGQLYKLFLGWYELKWETKDKIQADGVVVLSEYLKNKALDFKDEAFITKIHGGANIDNIPYIKNNSRIKKKYGISENCLTFGYLDAYDKSLSELVFFIDVLNELRKSIDIKIIVYGVPLKNEIKLSIGNGLIDFGWIDFTKQSDKFACSDVFIMFKEDNSINNAGWPNKIGEYMACGRPILLNPIGEMVQFAKNHPDGMFITRNNRDSIKKVILDIYNRKGDLMRKGELNRIIAEHEMSWNQKSKQLLSFYIRIKNATTNTTT